MSKKYKETMAVDKVSMTIKKGQIYGFIGQNGAGKTTIIRLITGLAHKTDGEIELFGQTDNLDEPINGLDPMSIVEIRELIKKLNNELGMTILISSHILGELSELATNYGIISHGKLIEEFTAKELREKCRQYIEIIVDDSKKATVLLEEKLGITNYEVINDNMIKVYDLVMMHHTYPMKIWKSYLIDFIQAMHQEVIKAPDLDFISQRSYLRK